MYDDNQRRGRRRQDIEDFSLESLQKNQRLRHSPLKRPVKRCSIRFVEEMLKALLLG